MGLKRVVTRVPRTEPITRPAPGKHKDHRSGRQHATRGTPHRASQTHVCSRPPTSSLHNETKPVNEADPRAQNWFVAVGQSVEVTAAVLLWDFGDTLADETWMRRAPIGCPDWPNAWTEVMREHADRWSK